MFTLKKIIFLFLFMIGCQLSYGQTTAEFKKSTLEIKEPYKNGKDTTVQFKVEFLLKNLDDKKSKFKATLIQIASGSTCPKDKVKLVTTSIDELTEKNSILIDLTTDAHADDDKIVILNVNYEDTKDPDHIKLQVSDTIRIVNTYPFKLTEPKEYTGWNDGKKVEVFIGTNFDFFGENTVTDWYGGISVFLPGITDFKYNTKKSDKKPRWGINAGLYHNKSFSNFGTFVEDERQIIERQVVKKYFDTINNVRVPVTDYRQDTIKVKNENEINNWGAYAGVMFQISKFEPENESFVTNIFVGVHAEVIRRSVSTTYKFDTVGTVIRTTYDPAFTVRNSRMPVPLKRSYFDSYFGVNLPIQLLWKDIIDLKLTPCFGFGSADYASSATNAFPPFYLINFDLLARLGGIRLMVGGEIRGYFPNNPPIMSAYLGTSFPISKITDFLSK